MLSRQVTTDSGTWLIMSLLAAWHQSKRPPGYPLKGALVRGGYIEGEAAHLNREESEGAGWVIRRSDQKRQKAGRAAASNVTDCGWGWVLEPLCPQILCQSIQPSANF